MQEKKNFIADLEPFGSRLKRLREIKNLSAKEFAQQVGVPESTYREWEYGRPQRVPPYAKLSEALGIPLSELMTGKAADLNWIVAELDLIEKQVREFRSRLVAHL